MLPALKDSARYVTLAAVRIGPDGLMEYALAGHLPILRFVRRTRSVEMLALSQMALGLFPDVAYRSATVRVEPGDLLMLLTDGLTEPVNPADEEFGLERVGAVLATHSDDSLEAIVDAVLAAVKQHGPQVDDQSLLVLRVDHCS